MRRTVYLLVVKVLDLVGVVLLVLVQPQVILNHPHSDQLHPSDRTDGAFTHNLESKLVWPRFGPHTTGIMALETVRSCLLDLGHKITSRLHLAWSVAQNAEVGSLGFGPRFATSSYK
ncbi:unnamed protein product [Pleuronectes platessa]|uniref:Uncharacterized protein n=1 Tax=Pleuronectes platessa TaxID=8262 RepID=A0A9N7VHE0_PLEPL|nr:unnamed protein product [Pleuronectes platessa]